MRIEQRGVGRQRAEPHRAVERAAGLLPVRLEQPERVLGRFHDGARGRELAAAGAVAPGQRDAVARGAFRHRDRDASRPASARAGVQPQGAVQREVRGPGIGADAHRARRDVGHGVDRHGLEIHEQRIRQDVVDAERAIVERGAVVALRREVAVVDHDVAGNALYAGLPQAVDEAPPALRGHERIAAAHQHEVALERLVAHGPRRVGARAPRVRRPERLERGERGQHFHGRRGIARDCGVEADHGFLAVHFAHVHAQAGRRQLAPREHLFDLGRQVRLVARRGVSRGADQQHSKQEQAEGERETRCVAHRTRHHRHES